MTSLCNFLSLTSESTREMRGYPSGTACHIVWFCVHRLFSFAKWCKRGRSFFPEPSDNLHNLLPTADILDSLSPDFSYASILPIHSNLDLLTAKRLLLALCVRTIPAGLLSFDSPSLDWIIPAFVENHSSCRLSPCITLPFTQTNICSFHKANLVSLISWFIPPVSVQFPLSRSGTGLFPCGRRDFLPKISPMIIQI
jgi:hypothetical protein